MIFTTEQGQRKPELNNFLGDLTDELPCNSIITFISGGPKNYGYELAKSDENGNRTHCKIRGITLNYKNKLNVKFDILKTFVTKHQDATVSVVNALKIARDNNSKVITMTENKKTIRLYSIKELFELTMFLTLMDISVRTVAA